MSKEDNFFAIDGLKGTTNLVDFKYWRMGLDARRWKWEVLQIADFKRTMKLLNKKI
jgi:hypothetical protein